MRQRFGVIASTIEIGGALADAAIIDLLAAAECDLAVLEGRQHEYDDEDLRRAVAPGRPLRFTRTAATHEEFPELETFCREHGLTYRRFGDGGPSGGPGVVFWAPGHDDAARAPADPRGRLYLTLADLEVALASGRALTDVVLALRRASGAVPALHFVVEPE